MNRPCFFLVGAPKCGTTALHHYLSQHPDVFMAEKELHFFARDIDIVFDPPMTEAYYLSCFVAAEYHQLCGDASVWHLSSESAPVEIKAFNKDAKILIMLRNPADMMYSLYSENVYNGFENISSFESALDAEADRMDGKRFIKDIEVPRSLWYTHNASYSKQVKRYFDVFSKESVHIIIYERFFSNPSLHYQTVLDFLCLKPGFEPVFDAINTNKIIHSKGLHHLIKHPPGFPKKVFRSIVPDKKIRHQMMSVFYKKNMDKGRRPELSAKLRQRINAQFRRDVRELETITGPIPEWLNEG